MKTLLVTTLLSSSLFASQAFAGGLSDFSSLSIEANLAAGHVATEQGFSVVNNPLSDLGASVEAHLSDDIRGNVSNAQSGVVASFGLVAPAQSKEA